MEDCIIWPRAKTSTVTAQDVRKQLPTNGRIQRLWKRLAKMPDEGFMLWIAYHRIRQKLDTQMWSNLDNLMARTAIICNSFTNACNCCQEASCWTVFVFARCHLIQFQRLLASPRVVRLHTHTCNMWINIRGIVSNLIEMGELCTIRRHQTIRRKVCPAWRDPQPTRKADQQKGRHTIANYGRWYTID